MAYMAVSTSMTRSSEILLYRCIDSTLFNYAKTSLTGQMSTPRTLMMINI